MSGPLPSVGLYLRNSGRNERAESLGYSVLPLGCTGTELSPPGSRQGSRLSSLGALLPHRLAPSALPSRPVPARDPFTAFLLSWALHRYTSLCCFVVQVPKQLISYTPGLQTASGFLLFLPGKHPPLVH